MCHAALSVKTNVFVRTQRFSREALEPRAHIMHVRDADKTSYGTLRENIQVCGNATLRAGLVSCVHVFHEYPSCSWRCSQWSEVAAA